MAKGTAAGVSPDVILRRWKSAWADLESLRGPAGIHASESGSGLYPAVFGRDTVWTVLLLLDAAERLGDEATTARVVDIAESALRPLVACQALETDDRVEAQPGKIPHAVWVDPPNSLAGLPLVDGVTYCGFDQTFLFVVAGARLLKHTLPGPWKATLSNAVRRALNWVLTVGIVSGGLVSYERRNDANPVHQVWKDSFDCITHGGYDMPTSPIAWIEVQAYAVLALREAAAMVENDPLGIGVDPRDLRGHADRLAAVAHEALWWPGEGLYAVAIDGAGRQVKMVTSNAGHALWGGLLPAGHARDFVRRLLRPDLMTSFGLRTLSSADRFFEAEAYHRGTVWPFDNAVVAVGCMRYRHEWAALQIAAAITKALDLLDANAELYGVIPRQALVDPAGRLFRPDSNGAEVIVNRRVPPQNVRQAFSAAGQVWFVTLLAEALGVRLTP
jgi:glycogen debranching enzyme